MAPKYKIQPTVPLYQAQKAYKRKANLLSLHKSKPQHRAIKEILLKSKAPIQYVRIIEKFIFLSPFYFKISPIS
jgi:hypothetical protein